MPFFDAAPQHKSGGLTDFHQLFTEEFAQAAGVDSMFNAVIMTCPAEGFYFQLGTNKAQTSLMFALKKEGQNIVWYASDIDTFVKEFTDVCAHIHEKYPRWAALVKNYMLFKQPQTA
jgi:hypothetical protein